MRAAAEHARVGCTAVRPRWGSGGLIAATPSGRAQKACTGPRLGCRSWMGGEARARGASSADGTVVVMGTRVTARATQCGTESRAAGLRRLATGRVGDATPMARRQEGGEGQRVLWRLPDAQLNSGSSAMSTRAATPDCSGEGAMTSSTTRCTLGSAGVHRAVSMKCPIQVPIANVRFENARGSRAFSDWSQVPISNVPSKNARGPRAFSKWSEGVVARRTAQCR